MNDPVVKLADCDVIKCSNCEKDLMIIKNKKQDTKQSQFGLSSKLQVKCPFCKDRSFIFETNGTFMYHPAPGIKINGAQDKDGVMEFLTSR